MRATVSTFMLLATACATPLPVAPPVSQATVGELSPGSGMLRGYLALDDLPDSLVLLPAPPVEGSARMAADREAFEEAARSTSPDRWRKAQDDAVLSFPASVAGYGQILGVAIDSNRTPHLAMLLQRSMSDVALATYAAKTYYQRTRPFVREGASTCTPADEPLLRKDGSYPSGHSAVGWGWALILVEVAPDKADALLQRGFDFGKSRVVCRAHWQSDVEAGRLMASATIARLQADPTFRSQLQLARSEIQRERAELRVRRDGSSEDSDTLR